MAVIPRHRWRLGPGLLLVCALGSGCQGCQGGGAGLPKAAQNASTNASATDPTTDPVTGRAPEPRAAAPAAPGPAPEGLTLALELAGGSATLVVQNRGDRPLSLRREVALERGGAGGSFNPSDGAGLWLRHSCQQQPPACVELWPGAELRPPPLQARRAPDQCGCSDCPPLEAGRYRLQVRGCDDAWNAPTEAFQVPF
ncbi:MAG: hypothetical protein OEZ06_13905 [Myxococcales bacterium]|nr:hypothetical protein [Myxococcales bacterium]